MQYQLLASISHSQRTVLLLTVYQTVTLCCNYEGSNRRIRGAESTEFAGAKKEITNPIRALAGASWEINNKPYKGTRRSELGNYYKPYKGTRRSELGNNKGK